MNVIETNKLNILSWADDVDESTRDQAANLANLPFAKFCIALIPDALAKPGGWLAIPGIQGSPSYIYTGLGNPLSIESCSHGAGRRMSRKKAKEVLNLSNEIAEMDKMGTVHSLLSINELDEAPGAYKNIDDVMRNQRDLVKVEYRLDPIMTIKGSSKRG